MQALAAGAAQARAAAYRVVSHAVELRDARAAVDSAAWRHGLARNHPALVARASVMCGSGRAMSRVMMTRSGSRNWPASATLLRHLPAEAALFFADELDIHLLPKIGYEWMLQGTQTEVMTPGTNQKQLFGRRAQPRDGQDARMSRLSARTAGLFIDLAEAH
ncbi:MAG: hypothetical protein WKG07_39930 [Hymenobacter sp.]